MYCVTLYLFFIRWWCNLNEFPPNFTSNWCPVEFTPNFTRNLCPVEFDWGDRIWSPPQIGWKFTEITLPIKGHTISVNLHNLHPIWPEIHARSNFKPNSISQAYKCNLSEFTPIFTNISCLVEFDRSNSTGGIEFDPPSNWVGITGMIPNSIRQNTNVISVNLHPFLPVFHARSNSTGGDRIWSPIQIGWESLGWYPFRLARHTNGISVNLHPFLPIFHARSNLTGKIQPGG